MPRRKLVRPPVPSSPWFRPLAGQRVWASAQYQEDGSVYLYVPRDGRYWQWHRCYWNGVPEWARHKDAIGLHWVASAYADSAASVFRAFYPEALVIVP